VALVVDEGRVDSGFWRGRRVFLTGHTGFKGSWLALWLQTMGASVHGLSVDVPTDPALYELARVGEGMAGETVADVRDGAAVQAAFAAADPEVVIHMAAQSLVRRSFAEPRETFDVNVMGTVSVLDAVRASPGVRVAIVVTSDKCYENREWEWGYREDEPMGGHDPYASSKGAAELVVAAYRRSFFSDERSAALATVRAGNVIGGGDWAAERLVPDIVRAVTVGETVRIRNPTSIRPWQHVISPLHGYLLLAQSLWTNRDLVGGWNFGPDDEDTRPVAWIVQRLAERWAGGLRSEFDPGPHPHEAAALKLDSSRARMRLGWRPRVDLQTALESIAEWHLAYANGEDPQAVTLAQIERLAG
jgi:CDP-glucose 4,6-dehydratase